MKIGFYSPYFDSLSGGERYVLTLAGYWSKKHEVTIFWDDATILATSEKRFHLDLSKILISDNVFFHGTLVEKLFRSSQFDVMFFLSDGSIPTSCASHNILHFQVPFQKISFPFWKRPSMNYIVCNSLFTKKFVDPVVGNKSSVIYPPVDIDQFSSRKKEKIILSVGRFTSSFQAKKQDILIEVFIEGVKKGMFKDCQLVLAGGLLESDSEYFSHLKNKAKGYSIDFFPNISFDHLKDLYSKAIIYWHAAGYNETNPQYMEHFGITTVEAMASGCIPIVYKAGGQPEIVNHGESGFLWDTKEECLKYTQDILHSEKLQNSIRRKAVLKSKAFSIAIFCKKFDELLDQISK